MAKKQNVTEVNNSNQSTQAKVKIEFTQSNKYKVGNEPNVLDEDTGEVLVKGAPIYEIRDTTFSTIPVMVEMNERAIEQAVIQLMNGIYKPIKMAIQLKSTQIFIDGQKFNLRGKFQMNVYVNDERVNLTSDDMLMDVLSNIEFTFKQSTKFAHAIYQLLCVSQNVSPILDNVQERKIETGVNKSYLLLNK